METRSRRLLALSATLVAIAIGASGCSALSLTASAGSTPRVGQCWTTTFSTVQKTEDWEGAAAVPCSAKHQSYTYAVTKLTTKFTYSSWLTSKNEIREDVDRAAYAACQAQQAKILPGITVKEALVYPTYFLPSVHDWAAGARWVRCDVSLIRTGSTIALPSLADLPSFATLTSTLAKDPEKYALCEDDPASNGPDGAETTYADCTGPSDWSFVASLTMTGANGAAYPGLSTLTAIGNTQCATLSTPAGHTVFAEPPSELDWTKFNDRELDCWVNNN